MKHRPSFFLCALVSVGPFLFTACPPETNPVPETPEAPISFKLDGVLVELKAGPSGTGTGADGSSTVTFEGIPSAFIYGSGSLTRIYASSSAAAFSTSYDQDAAGRLCIDFVGTGPGTYSLDGITDGPMTFDKTRVTNESNKITLIITSYGAVGGTLEGSFAGSLSDGAATYQITEGKLKVKIFPAINHS